MDRVDTRSSNKEGGAPEMVESNPTPTIPTTNPCPYGLRCRPLRRTAVLTSTRGGGSKGGGNNNRRRRKEEASSSRRGPEYSPPIIITQTEEERDAIWRAIDEEDEKEGRKVFPIYVANQAGEPAQLALEYYKNKEGVQLQLTEMISAGTELTDLGFITHLQFKASCGEPSDAPPKTVYAQIHKRGPWPNIEKAHASRVFTDESPLLKDPRFFEVGGSNGWIEYPYDCPACGLDFLDGRDGFKGLQLYDPRL